MYYEMIAAVGRNMELGRKGDLVWHIREDLRHFKRMTTGHPVIMGRKTWESLGRALPGRLNIVVTSNADYVAEGASVVNSLPEALSLAETSSDQTPFIIGGARIYAQALQGASRLILTEIDAEAPDADTYFPAIDLRQWRETERMPGGEEQGIRYDFVTYERI